MREILTNNNNRVIQSIFKEWKQANKTRRATISFYHFGDFNRSSDGEWSSDIGDSIRLLSAIVTINQRNWFQLFEEKHGRALALLSQIHSWDFCPLHFPANFPDGCTFWIAMMFPIKWYPYKRWNGLTRTLRNDSIHECHLGTSNMSNTLVRIEFNIKRHLEPFNQVNKLVPDGVFDYWADFNSHAIVCYKKGHLCAPKIHNVYMNLRSERF